jgi:hypothetical protein
MPQLSRRALMKSAGLSGVALGLGAFGSSQLWAQVIKEIHELKPGEFTWHPERSPDGPVAIVVSIPDQRVHVYRNGVRIAVSTCSTGKPGHSTPTGVFTILEKDKNHHSSTYNNAPMPNMNRLTWSGVALHAGNLPGYPASHGCIRLPAKFSELLFGVTHVGTPVIVADNHAEPKEVVHPGLVLSEYAEHEFETAVTKNMKGKERPWAATVDDFSKPTSVVVSRADGTLSILEDGRIVSQGKAYIKNPGEPLGSHVFILIDAHDGHKGLLWHGIGHHHESSISAAASEAGVIRRISSDKPVIEAMTQRMHPGMVLVTTDLPAHPDTRSAKDFVVMSVESS